MLKLSAASALDATIQRSTAFQAGLQPCAEPKAPKCVFHPSRRCELVNCLEPAVFGATRADRCEQHKRPDDNNYVEDTCSSCGLVFRLCANGLCDFCRVGPRARLGKQREVRNYLEVNLPEWPWDSYDSTLRCWQNVVVANDQTLLGLRSLCTGA